MLEEEEDKFLKENPIVFKKYKVKKKLGEGAFGEVYLGKAIENNVYVAMKVEPRKIAKPILESEAFLLYSIAGIGIPAIKSFGKVKNYTVLVEPLLGKSLFDIFAENHKQMPFEDICLIGKQIMDRIQWVHSKYIVHRDIKPDNFLIGRTDPNVIYLIDFGLSKKYRSSVTNKHIRFGFTGKLTGTVRFASANALRGGEQSRRDDIESIGYMLVYFMKKRLPWQGVTGTRKMERYLKIYKMKKHTTPEQLCEGLPPEMTEYMKYAKSLEFEQEPDYKYLRKLFSKMLKRYHKTNDQLIFSWIKLEDLPNLKNPVNPATRKDSPQSRIYKKIKSSLEKERNASTSSDDSKHSYQQVYTQANVPNSNLKLVDKNNNFSDSEFDQKTEKKVNQKVLKAKEGLNTMIANLDITVDENVVDFENERLKRGSKDFGEMTINSNNTNNSNNNFSKLMSGNSNMNRNNMNNNKKFMSGCEQMKNNNHNNSNKNINAFMSNNSNTIVNNNNFINDMMKKNVNMNNDVNNNLNQDSNNNKIINNNTINNNNFNENIMNNGGDNNILNNNVINNDNENNNNSNNNNNFNNINFNNNQNMQKDINNVNSSNNPKINNTNINNNNISKVSNEGTKEFLKTSNFDGKEFTFNEPLDFKSKINYDKNGTNIIEETNENNNSIDQKEKNEIDEQEKNNIYALITGNKGFINNNNSKDNDEIKNNNPEINNNLNNVNNQPIEKTDENNDINYGNYNNNNNKLPSGEIKNLENNINNNFNNMNYQMNNQNINRIPGENRNNFNNNMNNMNKMKNMNKKKFNMNQNNNIMKGMQPNNNNLVRNNLGHNINSERVKIKKLSQKNNGMNMMGNKLNNMNPNQNNFKNLNKINSNEFSNTNLSNKANNNFFPDDNYDDFENMLNDATKNQLNNGVNDNNMNKNLNLNEKNDNINNLS